MTGSSLTLTANDVVSDAEVTITVRDSVSATATATAKVKAAVLNNQVTLTPLAPLAGCPPSAVCSGGDANVTVTAILNTVKLKNRPILFTVVQGQFQFVTPNSLSLVNSITINSDENGLAVAKLTVAPAVPTQVATLTMTDTTTGLVKYFNFNIVQQTSGVGILSVLPSGDVTFTGPDGQVGGFSPGTADGQCPVGYVDMYIFGGTPPYRVASPLPSLVVVAGPGQPFAAETTLAVNGGFITAQIYGCGKTALIVTDATNRTVETASIIGVKGKDATVTAPPATTAPAVAPATMTFTACGQSATVNLTGTGTYTGTVGTPGAGPALTITPSSGSLPATVTITRTTGTGILAPPSPAVINFSNSAGTGTVTVTMPAVGAC